MTLFEESRRFLSSTPRTLCLISPVFLFLWGVSLAVAQDCALERLPDPVEFEEVAFPGKVLLTVNSTATEVWNFSIKRPSSLLEPYFRLVQTADHVSFILNRTFDLEEVLTLITVEGEIVNTLTFWFSCTSRNSTKVNYDWFATVIAVNEFAPKFLRLPEKGFNITEATQVGQPVIKFQEYVEDKDVTVNSPGLYFTLLPTADDKVDGRFKFELVDILSGALALHQPLDFEAMDPANAYFILNISVGDRLGMTSTATVRVNVIDADDQPPEFWYPGCEPPCFTYYSAAVAEDFQGEITWVSPAPIAARDMDALNSVIIYSFKQGYPGDFKNFLKIDSQTGVSSVIRPVNESEAAMFFIIVEAVEDTELRHSQQTTLWLTVIGRNSTLPTLPPLVVEVPNSENVFRTATIALAILLALILVVLIVFIFCSAGNTVRKYPVHPTETGRMSSGSGAVEPISTRYRGNGDEHGTESYKKKVKKGERSFTLNKTSNGKAPSARLDPPLRFDSSKLERAGNPDRPHLSMEISNDQHEQMTRQFQLSTISDSGLAP